VIDIDIKNEKKKTLKQLISCDTTSTPPVRPRRYEKSDFEEEPLSLINNNRGLVFFSFGKRSFWWCNWLVLLFVFFFFGKRKVLRVIRLKNIVLCCFVIIM